MLQQLAAALSQQLAVISYTQLWAGKLYYVPHPGALGSDSNSAYCCNLAKVSTRCIIGYVCFRCRLRRIWQLPSCPQLLAAVPLYSRCSAIWHLHCSLSGSLERLNALATSMSIAACRPERVYEMLGPAMLSFCGLSPWHIQHCW